MLKSDFTIRVKCDGGNYHVVLLKEKEEIGLGLTIKSFRWEIDAVSFGAELQKFLAGNYMSSTLINSKGRRFDSEIVTCEVKEVEDGE